MLSKELDPIIQYLKKQDDISLLAIFGSFARNKERVDSDIDIAIASDRPIDRERLKSIANELFKLTDREVDIVDLNRMHAPLLQEIFHDAVWVKKNPQIYYQILKRALFEAADFLPIRNRILKERIKRFSK